MQAYLHRVADPLTNSGGRALGNSEIVLFVVISKNTQGALNNVVL